MEAGGSGEQSQLWLYCQCEATWPTRDPVSQNKQSKKMIWGETSNMSITILSCFMEDVLFPNLMGLGAYELNTEQCNLRSKSVVVQCLKEHAHQLLKSISPICKTV